MVHPIEEQGSFLEVSRYVHLNPVRAKRVARPDAWRWSSCPGYLRAGRQRDWVCYQRVLGEFGRDGGQAWRAYGRFLQAALAELPPSPFSGAAGGLIVGTRDFGERVRRMIQDKPEDGELPQRKRLRSGPSLAMILAVVAAHFGVEPGHWAAGRRSDDAARAVAAYLARRRFAGTRLRKPQGLWATATAVA